MDRDGRLRQAVATFDPLLPALASRGGRGGPARAGRDRLRFMALARRGGAQRARHGDVPRVHQPRDPHADAHDPVVGGTAAALEPGAPSGEPRRRGDGRIGIAADAARRHPRILAPRIAQRDAHPRADAHPALGAAQRRHGARAGRREETEPHARTRVRARSVRADRPGPHAADRAEPARQCDQVHVGWLGRAARRLSRRQTGPHGFARDRSPRYRDRHSARTPAHHPRAVPARRAVAEPPRERQRTGAVDLPRTGRPDERRGDRQQQPRQGHDLHGALAGATRRAGAGARHGRAAGAGARAVAARAWAIPGRSRHLAAGRERPDDPGRRRPRGGSTCDPASARRARVQLGHCRHRRTRARAVRAHGVRHGAARLRSAGHRRLYGRAAHARWRAATEGSAHAHHRDLGVDRRCASRTVFRQRDGRRARQTAATRRAAPDDRPVVSGP